MTMPDWCQVAVIAYVIGVVLAGLLMACAHDVWASKMGIRRRITVKQAVYLVCIALFWLPIGILAILREDDNGRK